MKHTCVIRDRESLPVKSKRRVDADGILHARGVVARAGVQRYRASELGLEDRDPDSIVKIYRSPATLAAALDSFEDKALTMGHPDPDQYPDGVTADNWDVLAVGHFNHLSMEGRLMYADLHVGKKSAVDSVQTKRAELSNSYRVTLDMSPGVDPETGEAYDGEQVNMRGNHSAIIIRTNQMRARGGDVCRVLDHQKGDQKMAKRIVVVTDSTGKATGHELDADAASLVERILGERDAATRALSDANTAHTKALADATAALNKEITTLKGQVQTPDQIAAMVADRASVITECAAVCPSIKIADSMTTAAIRRAMLGDLIGRSETAKRLADAIIPGGLKDDTEDGKIKIALDSAKVVLAGTIADGERLDTNTSTGLCPRTPVEGKSPTNDSENKTAPKPVGRDAFVQNLISPPKVAAK